MVELIISTTLNIPLIIRNLKTLVNLKKKKINEMLACLLELRGMFF